MSSSNPNPRRVPIVDNLPLAPVRSRRGGRLRSLRSSSSRVPSIPLSSSTPPSITRGSLSQRSSSRTKEPTEPLREPLVDEIVPAELSFYNDGESIRNQLSSLDRADIYPTQITEGLISVVRRDCHWSHGHKTTDCRLLQGEVDHLLKQGYLTELFSEKGKQAYMKNRQELPKTLSPKRTVNVISGGEEINGVAYTTANKVSKVTITHGKRVRHVLEEEYYI